jgi:hypothetical protein
METEVLPEEAVAVALPLVESVEQQQQILLRKAMPAAMVRQVHRHFHQEPVAALVR